MGAGQVNEQQSLHAALVHENVARILYWLEAEQQIGYGHLPADHPNFPGQLLTIFPCYLNDADHTAAPESGVWTVGVLDFKAMLMAVPSEQGVTYEVKIRGEAATDEERVQVFNLLDAITSAEPKVPNVPSPRTDEVQTSPRRKLDLLHRLIFGE